MRSKDKPPNNARGLPELTRDGVFYDFYRLLSRGEIEGKHLARYIKETRLVWHVDGKGEWRLTPDISRGAFTVKKALSQLARMAPHYKPGTSVWDPSDPPEPEEWLEPRGVYGYPSRELYRLDLLRPNHSRRFLYNKSPRKAGKPLAGIPNPNQKNLIFSIAGALLLIAVDGDQRLIEEFSGSRSYSRWRKRIIDMIKQETGLKGDTNRIVGALGIAVDNFLDSRTTATKVSKRNSKAEILKEWYASISAGEADSKKTR